MILGGVCLLACLFIHTYTYIQGGSKSGGESTTDSGSAVNTTVSSKSEPHQFEPESPISKKASSSSLDHQKQQQLQQHQMANDASRTGPSQNQSAAKQDKVFFSFLYLFFDHRNFIF